MLPPITPTGPVMDAPRSIIHRTKKKTTTLGFWLYTARIRKKNSKALEESEIELKAFVTRSNTRQSADVGAAFELDVIGDVIHNVPAKDLQLRCQGPPSKKIRLRYTAKDPDRT
ncbi:hypothetical protein CVT25_003826 [Psilocybe cyanescens]|uniref:Uncharacterized protein n=1 Tax=Psilocybe cyanescens TaxID=93625 RepID=A0A409XTN6_PSICY|nr:hypothetical protein CVT25_003826 [Psilocybe cyanescens]